MSDPCERYYSCSTSLPQGSDPRYGAHIGDEIFVMINPDVPSLVSGSPAMGPPTAVGWSMVTLPHAPRMAP